MDDPEDEFPYEARESFHGVEIVERQSRRTVACFRTHRRATLELEKLRVWWERVHAFPFLELEVTIVRALDRWEASKPKPSGFRAGDA